MIEDRMYAIRKFKNGDGAARGFTLLEVVTAVFVFLLGVVGVISLFAAATVLHKSARDKTLSSLMIEQVVSEIDAGLKTGAFRTLDGNLMPKAQGSLSGDERYGYEVEFREEDLPGRSMVVARIRVTWRDKGLLQGEEFDYLFRPGPGFRSSVSSLIQEGN